MVLLSGGFQSLPAAGLLVVSLAVQSCSATMSAWWTDKGPQIIRQNLTTGLIMYSMCNSNGTNNTPIFPTDPPFTFSLAYKPRNGTSVTGQGWWSPKDGGTQASIFYQSEDGDIVNSYHSCDWSTGRFNKLSDVIISSKMPTPKTDTGLASVVLGADDGYRVYYHDDNKTVHSIGYRPKSNEWYYAGVVTRDAPTGTALAANFAPGGQNISVVMPRDAENIEVARLNSAGQWWLSTMPRPLAGSVTANTNLTNATDIKLDTQADTNFTLASWTGRPGALGLATDKDFTRHVFYVGEDRQLRQLSSQNFVWRPVNANQSRAIWPLADAGASPLALASNFGGSVVRVYYDVNGSLHEMAYSPSTFWKRAVALPLVNTTKATADPPPSGTGSPGPSQTADPSSQESSSSGLSTGAKAGIGVGVSVGVLAVIGALVAVWLMRRRQARQAQLEADQAEAEEKQRQAAALQQQQQQHNGGSSYYGGSTTYHGSPPPPSEVGVGGGYAWAGADHKVQYDQQQQYQQQQQHGGYQDYGHHHHPTPPPPQELYGAAQAQELPSDGGMAELPEQRGFLEMAGQHGNGRT